MTPATVEHPEADQRTTLHAFDLAEGAQGSADVASLVARYRALLADLARTRDQLRLAAEELSDRGQPPGFALMSGLAAAHRAFLRIRRDVRAECRARGQDVPALPSGLAELLPLLQVLCGPAREEPVTVAKITAETGRPLWPKVETLTERTDPHDATPETVANGQHPYEPAPDSPFPAGEAVKALSPADLEPPASVYLQDGETVRESELAEGPLEISKPEPPTEAVETESPPTATKAAETETSPTVTEGADSPRVMALQVLDRVARLRVKRGQKIPELESCLEQVRSLRNTLAACPETELPPEVAELVEGRHHLVALMTMLERSGKLGDLEWADLHARVVAGLGRTIALAAVRDRLTIDP